MYTTTSPRILALLGDALASWCQLTDLIPPNRSFIGQRSPKSASPRVKARESVAHDYNVTS